MIRRSEISRADLLLAAFVAFAAQALTLTALRVSGGELRKAPVEPLDRPISVAVNPVFDLEVEPLPALKLGSKPKPNRLPDMVQKPQPVQRAQAAATPSPKAEATREAIPDTQVSDAGPPPPDAEITKEVDPTIPPVEEPGREAVSTTEGAPDGVEGGTETDPLKAHAVSLYRAQLDSWFSSRFRIRGQIPFETLKELRARVTVTIGQDRTVQSFRITSSSGNETFDAKLKASLEAIQSSGSELPPPPPMYPDILGQSLNLSFSCKNRSLCE